MPLSTQPPPDDDFDNTPATQDKDAEKPAETGTPGTKSVLTPAKDSIPAAQVAQQQPMEPSDPNTDPGNPQDQVFSSQILPPRDPDKAWQERAVEAINGLYPRLRNGIDYAVGRKSLMADVELLAGQEAGIDWGKVEAAARKLTDADPYNDYKPRPGLAPPMSKGVESGEVPYRGGENRELPPNVAQSEVNPQTEAKVPTQAYPEEPAPQEQPA